MSVSKLCPGLSTASLESHPEGCSFRDSAVFYENVNSIHAKLRLYKSYGIQRVAFWRIGQGPNELWDTLNITSR